MEYCSFEIDVPKGYCLCPYPKQWLREFERIRLDLASISHVGFFNEIDVVLSLLSTHGALITWTTAFSGAKGTTEFIVGLVGDKYYHEPDHNNRGEKIVSVQAKNVRLYGKLSKKSFS